MSKIPPDVRTHGDTTIVDLMYPPREHGNEGVRYIEVGICDVRAADSIRIHYDFERDGYSIQQASRFAWADANDTDADWQEVAFVQAWARKETQEQEDARISDPRPHPE